MELGVCSVVSCVVGSDCSNIDQMNLKYLLTVVQAMQNGSIDSSI